MNRVAAVIVTFNNNTMLLNLLNDLTSQTTPPDEIIVVDNGKSAQNSGLIFLKKFPDIIYIHLPWNAGSAGGYYEGLKTACKNNDLIWTLDDDVRLFPDSLENLVKGYKNLYKKIRLSSVRSVGANFFSSKPSKLDLFPWRGTLIRSDLIKKYGLPLKEYFIYGEDLEYSLRFSKNGYNCYWIPDSKCIEVRPEGKDTYKLLGTTTIIYSKPFQLYYAFRNHLNLFIKYKEFQRLFKLLLYSSKVILFTIILEKQNKLKKIIAVLSGLLDGLTGHLGKNDKYLPAN